jgi:hypothetical protein
LPERWQIRARPRAAQLQSSMTEANTFTEELMKRNYVYGLTAAIGIAACSAVQMQASQDMSGAGTTAKNETVVTGCLVAADESGTAGATGTSGSTAGVTANAGHFKLTDAIVSAASGSGTATGSDMGSTSAAGSTAAGSTAGTSGSATHPSFVLVGKDSDLKQNLNSRVEVRGTIQANAFSSNPAGSTASGTTTGGTTATGSGVGTTGTGSSVTASAMTQTLRVTSVKKISGSCAQ